MPNFNGVYATREILKELPATRIILVSAHHSREYIMEGIHAGIRGFLPKEARSGELVMAIKALARGETWFRGSTAELLAPGFVDSIYPAKAKTRQEPVLTPREKEIVRYLAKGMNSHEIAKKLSISKRTVDVHKFNIFKKLDISNAIELMRYAIRHNLVKV
jgi:DNA-binding NarL/FixJ family response regulator